MRDRVQQIVVRDHFDPDAIGILDDSGHPKKGRQTACLHRHYCGRTGKIDNCVVSVHLSCSYSRIFAHGQRANVLGEALLRKSLGYSDEAVSRRRNQI